MKSISLHFWATLEPNKMCKYHELLIAQEDWWQVTCLAFILALAESYKSNCKPEIVPLKWELYMQNQLQTDLLVTWVGVGHFTMYLEKVETVFVQERFGRFLKFILHKQEGGGDQMLHECTNDQFKYIFLSFWSFTMHPNVPNCLYFELYHLKTHKAHRKLTKCLFLTLF